MPKTSTLLVSFTGGLLIMFLFAFTLVGVVGEGVTAAALLGLILRGSCAGVAWVRGAPRC